MGARVMITGGSGFVGSNVADYLRELGYDVAAPTRSELNLLSREDVLRYVDRGRFDAVLHFASPSPMRSPNCDSYETLFENSLDIFMNLYAARNYYGKMLYSGSGAEYDRRIEIASVSEDQIGESIPVDRYGLSKFLINEIARSTSNIINMRIFACFGPREYSSKFITHAIRCCLAQRPITIRQDCYFDYLYIEDYARYITHFIEARASYNDYNVVSGKRLLLSEIARIVSEMMGSNNGVVISAPGLNKEYTASNARLLKDTGLSDPEPIEYGIEELIKWERERL